MQILIIYQGEDGNIICEGSANNSKEAEEKLKELEASYQAKSLREKNLKEELIKKRKSRKLSPL